MRSAGCRNRVGGISPESKLGVSRGPIRSVMIRGTKNAVKKFGDFSLHRGTSPNQAQEQAWVDLQHCPMLFEVQRVMGIGCAGLRGRLLRGPEPARNWAGSFFSSHVSTSNPHCSPLCS